MLIYISSRTLPIFSLIFQENQALSVQIDSTNANKEYPILAVVRQQKSVLSWQLPMFIETASAGPRGYIGVSRTLCPEHSNGNEPAERDLFLGVSTSQTANIEFNTGVTVIQDFLAK